jgi:hypothetical protein
MFERHIECDKDEITLSGTFNISCCRLLAFVYNDLLLILVFSALLGNREITWGLSLKRSDGL